VQIADRIKADVTSAMKAGERNRVTALRLVLSELQKAAKEGDDDELSALVRTAIAETGASTPRDMGRVIKQVMEAAGGRADGKRVSTKVKEALS